MRRRTCEVWLYIATSDPKQSSSSTQEKGSSKVTPKKSVSTNIAQNFTSGWAVFFLQILYMYMQAMTDANIYMIVANASDVDKTPCSINKNDISTSLRRCGRHCTCMYYVCMRAYQKFAVEAWKSLRSALQNAVGRVSRNRDFFRCGLSDFVSTVYTVKSQYLIPLTKTL